MKDYDNGTLTRRLILDACKKLFLEKGFHATSSKDICSAAHVIRSSIYYHFKDRENIRYDVLWEYVLILQHYAQQICSSQKHVWMVSMYAQWIRFKKDADFRRFNVEYFQDYPVYQPNSPLTGFFVICYEQMYSRIRSLDKIDPMAFSSFYGFFYGLLQMLDENPEGYTVRSTYRHCMTSGLRIWNFSEEEITQIWQELEPWLDKVSEEDVMALDLTAPIKPGVIERPEDQDGISVFK